MGHDEPFTARDEALGGLAVATALEGRGQGTAAGYPRCHVSEGAVEEFVPVELVCGR